jgi:polyisoprenoid-binding protein YceI
MKKLLIGAFALMAVACQQQQAAGDAPLAGAWKVQPEQSRVSFATIKAGSVVESHHFKNISGDIAADGTAKMTLDLTSLQTQPESRFTRMQENLFEVTTYPNATITTKLDPAKYEGLKVGERRVETVPVKLDLRGAQVDYDVEVFVTRAGPDTVIVETTQPIVVEAGDFNMTAGVAKLQELANLNAITPASPVTFSLTFNRAG